MARIPGRSVQYDDLGRNKRMECKVQGNSVPWTKRSQGWKRTDLPTAQLKPSQTLAGTDNVSWRQLLLGLGLLPSLYSVYSSCSDLGCLKLIQKKTLQCSPWQAAQEPQEAAPHLHQAPLLWIALLASWLWEPSWPGTADSPWCQTTAYYSDKQ